MTFHRRMPLAALLCTAVALSILPASATAGETLVMKFKPGETYGYLITQKMNVAGEAQGQTVNSEMGQTLSISTHIKSVDEDGNAKAEQSIDRVQMKMVLPPPISQTIVYDTDSDEVPDNPIVKQMAEGLGKMVGEAISMTISPQGKMSDVVVPEKVKATQQAAGGAMGGANQIEQMFKQSGLHLPAEEISKGHTWEQTMEMNLPYGKMVTTTTYTYKGQNEDGLHKIDAKMDVELQAGEDAPMKVTAETKEANGTFLFDNQAGRLKSSEIKQVLEMVIGGVAKQSITTEVTMTLTDGSKPESSSRGDE